VTSDQGELNLGLDDSPAAGGLLEITDSRMGHLWDALFRGFDRTGLPTATGDEEVFRQLVPAWIIERASKQDSLRVLQEARIDPASYPTVNGRLPVYARASGSVRRACPTRTGVASWSISSSHRAGQAAPESGPHSPTDVHEFGWSQVNAWLPSSTVTRPDFDSYLICATPRSGSTLLCSLLDSSGVAGHPASYFNRKSLNEYADDWRIARPRDGRIDEAFVRAALTAGKTSNGVFGGRIMAETLPELISGLAAAASVPEVTDVDLLSAQFGQLRYVHLRRRDVVAQAVSWAKSLQTHFWHPGEAVAPGGQDPHYDEELIGRLVATIERSEADWTVWFASHNIVPCEVTYEELAADPPRTAQEVLDYLGLNVPPDRQLVAGHRRQADQLNADWITRFKSR
jgi:LPS sulfotransferase NodH